ncbi:MAG: RNA polymerase sigma factor [Fidelibacterota bacterium]
MTRPQLYNDQQLVAAIQQGDKDSFRELYDRHKDRLYRVSLMLCQNRQDAEDAFQESFVKIFKNIGTLRNPDRVTAWMLRIVVNTAKTKLKVQPETWNELEEKHTVMNSTTHSTSLNNWNELLSAVRRLPLGYRNVFVLHAIQDLPQETVASILNISTGTVKSQFHRARKKLQIILKEMGLRFENQ